jgi:hypothetical protein
VGVSNYNKLIQEAYDRNYIALQSVFTSQPATTAYKSLVNNAQDYISDIGQANYNKLLSLYANRVKALNK